MVCNRGLELWRKLPSKDPRQIQIYVLSYLGTWGEIPRSQHNLCSLLTNRGEKEGYHSRLYIHLFSNNVWTTVFVLETFRNCARAHCFRPFLSFFFFCSLKPAWKTKGRLPISLTVNKKERKKTHTCKPQRNVFKMQTVVWSIFVLSIRQKRSGAELSGLSCELLICNYESRFTQHQETNADPAPRMKAEPWSNSALEDVFNGVAEDD